jgi:hypothetical protein
MKSKINNKGPSTLTIIASWRSPIELQPGNSTVVDGVIEIYQGVGRSQYSVEPYEENEHS